MTLLQAVTEGVTRLRELNINFKFLKELSKFLYLLMFFLLYNISCCINMYMHTT